jgi:uncharacterized protein (TIGR03437 family)
MRLVCSIAVALVAPFALAQSVTYSRDIAPIIYANCSTCHRPGQVSPFSLLTYDDVAKHGRTIAAVTLSRYMPPWKPENGWVAYRDQRGLTDAQIALIQQWVADGMPQGDPSQTPPVPNFPDGWQLGTPDLILTMPVGFNVPAEGTDVYRNFVLPTGITEDKWVRAIELKPTARSVVHHALFYSTTSAQARAMDGQDGQPGFPGFGTVFTVLGDPTSALNGGLGAWVPGTTPQYLPDGITMPLPKGSDLLLQMHFHLNGAPQVEQTTVGIYYGPKPARDITEIQAPAFFGVQANIDIPAGVSDYKVRGSFTLPVDVDAVSVSAHSHYLGKSAKLTATLPSGEVKILLWIKNWDFNWQDRYIFKDLIPLPAGTRLDGEYTYDNSTANPVNPFSPPQRVKWGEQSTDEMGSLILDVLPHVESDLGLLRLAVVAYSVVQAPQVGNKPLFVSSAIVDGASGQPGKVTPGKIVVLYGSRVGPSTLTGAQLTSDGRVATQLAGTEVLFDGTPAPLLYAASGQLAAVVPYGVDGKIGTQVQVKTTAGLSDPVALPVTPVAPSLFSADFTGSGQGAIVNQDGSTNSSQKPAAKGSIVLLFATGEGQTSPAGLDGRLASAAILPRPTRDVHVFINGKSADVLYAGGVGGQVAGLMQVNVRIPADAASGDLPVQVQVGDAQSQPGITVAVQ